MQEKVIYIFDNRKKLKMNIREYTKYIVMDRLV